MYVIKLVKYNSWVFVGFQFFSDEFPDFTVNAPMNVSHVSIHTFWTISTVSHDPSYWEDVLNASDYAETKLKKRSEISQRK